MKKINISDILKITKDIFAKTCIYFSIIVILFNILGKFLQNTSFALNVFGALYTYDPLAQNFAFMLLFASFFAGTAFQVFKIKKLPAISRHIAFFVLLYIDFILIVLFFTSYQPTGQDATLLLSVAFITIYLVILGIVMGIKAIINVIRNSNLKYENQFKNLK